ncbi:hypothetical protein, partial [Escherichia coli]|uniref:hypothetical protein n=1 Tax=Escherichia coli TaxID=562 RepID=UPI001BC8A950
FFLITGNHIWQTVIQSLVLKSILYKISVFISAQGTIKSLQHSLRQLSRITLWVRDFFEVPFY